MTLDLSHVSDDDCFEILADGSEVGITHDLFDKVGEFIETYIPMCQGYLKLSSGFCRNNSFLKSGIILPSQQSKNPHKFLISVLINWMKI